MKTINILIKKELSINFSSWSIYVGYVVFFCVCGFYAWLSNDNLFYIGQASLMPVFTIVNWALLFLIPALTMRSIAEEKRNRTIELILTHPIKTDELIGGKFLANLIITVIALVLLLPYYITISILGDVDHGSTLLGFLGLVCISASYISIGLFSSALSHNSVSAFFISIGIGLCFQVLFGMLAGQISNGFIAAVFSYLSMEEHLDTLSRGILDSRDIIYFGSICVLFLTLSKHFIYKARL